MSNLLNTAKKNFNKLVMGTSLVAVTGCGGAGGAQMEVPSQLDTQFAKATPRPKMAKSLTEISRGQPFPRLEDLEWGGNPFYKAEMARHDLMFYADVHAHLLRGKAANNTCEKDLMDEQLDILKEKLETTNDFFGESYPDFEPVAKAMERCLNLNAATQVEWLMARDEQRYREKEETYIRYMEFYRENKDTPVKELDIVPLPSPHRYIASGPSAFSAAAGDSAAADVRPFRPSVGRPYPASSGVTNKYTQRSQSGLADDGAIALPPLRGSGLAYEESVETMHQYREQKAEQQRERQEQSKPAAKPAAEAGVKHAPQNVRLENIPLAPSAAAPVTASASAPAAAQPSEKETPVDASEWFRKPSAYDYKTPAEYVRALHAYCQEAELKMVRGDIDPTTDKAYQLNGQQKQACAARLKYYRK